MAEWTEGICADGAAILRDGQLVTINELLTWLNAMDVYVERLEITLKHIASGECDIPEDIARDALGRPVEAP